MSPASDFAGDALIVGGGMIGLCSAWYLRKAGLSVTVLSREPVGEGTSAGNAGMIVPSHVVPLSAPGVISQGLRWLTNSRSPFYIKPRADLDLMRWLWRFRAHCTDRHVAFAAPILADLCLRSVDLFGDLQAEAGEFSWRQTGLMTVYRTPKYRDDAMKSADLAEVMGLRIRRLDEVATRAVEPGIRSDVLGAMLYEDDGRIDPESFLRVMRAALDAMDVRFAERVEVTGLESTAQGVRVTASGNRYEADHVVLAAGAWSPRLAALVSARIPVQPAKGYSITIPAPEGSPRIPMILSEDKITITPMPGRIRFGGTLALAGFDPSVDAGRYAPIRAQALRYSPDIPPETIDASRAWSGFRPASPDGLPLVGALRGHPRVIAATGHGMMGVTLGPVTGRLVSDLITGRRPVVDPAPLDPNRF